MGELIPLLWSTAGERALARGFSFNMGGMKYPCVCSRRMQLPGRDVTVRRSERPAGDESEKKL